MTEEKQQKLEGLKRTYSECLARVRSARTGDQITVAARPFAYDLQRLTPQDDDVFDAFLDWIRAPYSGRQPPRMH